MLNRYANLLQGLARDVTALGSSPFYGYLCLLFLVFQPARCAELLLAFALLMGICYAIKACWFRPRPDHVEGVEHQNVLEQVDASSFPSAHSARGAALFWILMPLVEQAAVVAVLALGALMVGASRVVLRRHSGVDVLAGLVIGSASALVVRWLGVAWLPIVGG